MNPGDKAFLREYELLAWRWYGISTVVAFGAWRWWLIPLTLAIFFPCIAAVLLLARMRAVSAAHSDGEEMTNESNLWRMQ